MGIGGFFCRTQLGFEGLLKGAGSPFPGFLKGEAKSQNSTFAFVNSGYTLKINA
jgi:hypothetical protein